MTAAPRMCLVYAIDTGWVDRWWKRSAGLQLVLLRQRGGDWIRSAASPKRLLGARAYEPSVRAYAGRKSASVSVNVTDLSRLSALPDPGVVASELLPSARATKHSVYALETGTGYVYIPAMLLIRELWLWSPYACQTLLSEHGLDTHVGVARPRDDGVEFIVHGLLPSEQPSNIVLRRLAWLAQCNDARRSWDSVLASAQSGVIGLSLPKATLKARAWGIQLDAGILACELTACELWFDLPWPDARIRIGRKVLACPPALTGKHERDAWPLGVSTSLQVDPKSPDLNGEDQ